MNTDQILDDALNQIEAALVAGLRAGAQAMEDDAKETTMYVGMSGATRASTVAYVATENEDGYDKVLAAAVEAQALLTGFTAHDGKVQIETLEPMPSSAIYVILTVPTDYIYNLCMENGGLKNFLTPIMLAHGPQLDAAMRASVQKILS